MSMIFLADYIDVKIIFLFGKIYFSIPEKPETPQSLSVTEILSRAVRLSWSQGFDGNSPLEAYTIQYCALSAQGAIRVSHWDSATTLNVSVHGPSHAHVMYEGLIGIAAYL